MCRGWIAFLPFGLVFLLCFLFVRYGTPRWAGDGNFIGIATYLGGIIVVFVYLAKVCAPTN